MTGEQEPEAASIRTRATRYSSAAMLLHWALALLMAFQLALGWQLHGLEKGTTQFAGYQLHKSIGITILLLSLGRIGIRFWHPRPPALGDSIWARWAAKSVHALLYVVMIGGPLTGWIIVSTAKVQFATLLFGVVPWPHLPLSNALHEPSESLHAALAWLFAALLVLHIVGALRHQFVKDENILARMMPVALTSRMAALASAVLAVGAMGAAFATGDMWSFSKESIPTVVAVKPATNSTEADKSDMADDAKVTPAIEATALQEAELAAADPEPLADWAITPGGRLGFTAQWNGDGVNGSFARWSGKVRFSPDDLANSTIRTEVDVSSASTSDSQRDEMLHGSDFFNVAAHPTAVFNASSMRHLGGNRYRASGSLAMHGISRPVALDFKLDIAGDTARVSGSTRVSRTSFEVGSGEWAATDQIADAVAVSFSFSARRK
jgi:cytochrome b561/polyisoprenoid-binding protein YceI